VPSTKGRATGDLACGERPRDPDVAALTDLYELTMAASYVAHGLDRPATFELFVRRLPAERAFLVACGIEPALEHLEHLRFSPGTLAYLEGLRLFERAFLDRLAALRFTGDVWAVAEGEVCFAGEPLLRATGPLVEVQVLETFLLACVGFETMVASKAARVALACAGRPFVDFSARRDHGPGAALAAARAAYVGGASATSNVLAGMRHGIPLEGTMAHSYVMSFPTETDAFRAFARDFPARSTLLIDTYDTVEGARIAARVADEVAADGIRVQAVRLDSGDLLALSREVRRVLDAAGHPEIRILASGDLDEHAIARLVREGAAIDGFGVGTRLGTSADAPSLPVVYKLVEDASGPKAKLAPGKRSLPGPKQVHRATTRDGSLHDVLALADEPAPPGTRPLLARVIAGGRRTSPPAALEEARERRAANVAGLPARLRSLEPVDPPFEPEVSEALAALAARAAGAAGTGRR